MEPLEIHLSHREAHAGPSACRTIRPIPTCDASRIISMAIRYTSEETMKHHTITGGGGTRLRLIEAGDPRAPSILFLHGCSQSWLTWDRQMRSELARRYRLVAMDLRGHGSSERPRDGYDDSRLWAADVDAAIRELELDRPILCGWSYGPLVILDYVRHHGEERSGGMHLVGAVTKLGSEAALSVLSPEFLSNVPLLFSQDAEE